MIRFVVAAPMVAVPFFTGSLCHPVLLFCNRILIVFVVLGCVIHLVSHTCLSVYTCLPIYYDPSCVNVYLNVLGELEGFIASQGCDLNIIAGDFNVDFDRGGQFAKLLKDFMTGVRSTCM